MSGNPPEWPLMRWPDECPIKDGFRQRGCDMTRIETFTDAAFAFAVTLLVVSIDAIPTTYDELVRAMLGAPAFGLSFLLLMLFWHGHWAWSRRFGLEDTPSVVLSCMLVFVMLCYVYPLKMIMGGMLSYFTGGALPTGMTLTGTQQLYEIFAIYGAGFSALSLVVVLLNLHAWRRRDALRLNVLELFDTRCEIIAWSIMVGVGLLSLGLALTLPPSVVSVPGWAYMLLAVVMPAFGVWAERRRKTMLPE